MNVLITGHRGFVGRHFCTALNDHSITGIDIKEGNDCRDFFKECQARFDLIIHLAAIVGGRQTIENDPLSVATDLSIDAEFFNWCVRTKQDGSIIYYSSSAAYPTKLQERPYRLKESDLDLSAISNPDMTYGWAKLTGEYLAKFAKENYGLRVYTFRPFSGYGADQDLSYPFPSFIQRAKAQLDPFEIWGECWRWCNERVPV
jgi:nucleoside-diphosphate-sugar epimerase